MLLPVLVESKVPPPRPSPARGEGDKYEAEHDMTTFTERAWEETSGLYRRILELPFNRELAAGTLSEARFRFYMTQDALYLTQYSRVLAVASAKAPQIEAMQFYAKAADTALVVERALHGGFFAKFGIEPAEAAAAEPSPTCFGYTNFLLATAVTDGYAELTAAVLPCFWFYWEVGKHIAGIARAGNPYQAWIDTYADPGFGEAVNTAIGALRPCGRRRFGRRTRKPCCVPSSARPSSNGCSGTARIGARPGRFPSTDGLSPHAEDLAENALALRRDRDGAGAGDAADPALLEALGAERRADRAGQMRPPLAPVEAGPAEDAGALAACGGERRDIDAEPVEQRDARLRSPGRASPASST